MESACTLLGMFIVKTTEIILMMHKDAEETEALCQSAVRDGGNATQKGSDLQSSSVCIRENLPNNKQ